MLRILARFLGTRSVVSGAALYVGMRWFDRLVGVISTIVLARLLSPDDFGIVALASVVMGLAVVMFDLGVNIAVVQRSGLDQDDLDTAWSLRLLQNAIISVAIAALAVPAAQYYGDSRLELVLWVIACGYLLEGFTSIGPVVFQKRKQYGHEVGFYMARRILGFAVTIALAFWFRNYWALLAGALTGNAGGVLLSYAMYGKRPRFTLVRWRRFIGDSFWLALRTMASYASQELDKFVVGRRDGTAVLGGYSIASQIAAMPSTELLAPVSRALFPALSAVKDDASELRRMFLAAVGVQCALALPAAVGLAVVAEDLVPVMLGEKWIASTPIMVALALAFGANALTHGGTYLLLALGRYRAQFLLHFGLAVALALLVFVIFPKAGANEIAWFRTALAMGGIVAIAALSLQCLPTLSLRELLLAVRRPVIATLAMAGTVVLLGETLDSLPAWGRLSVKVLAGAMTYGVSLLVLWRMEGRPEGAERWIWGRLESAVQVMRKKLGHGVNG